jgi:hypothetical protein
MMQNLIELWVWVMEYVKTKNALINLFKVWFVFTPVFIPICFQITGQIRDLDYRYFMWIKKMGGWTLWIGRRVKKSNLRPIPGFNHLTN